MTFGLAASGREPAHDWFVQHRNSGRGKCFWHAAGAGLGVDSGSAEAACIEWLRDTGNWRLLPPGAGQIEARGAVLAQRGYLQHLRDHVTWAGEPEAWALRQVYDCGLAGGIGGSPRPLRATLVPPAPAGNST